MRARSGIIAALGAVMLGAVLLLGNKGNGARSNPDAYDPRHETILEDEIVVPGLDEGERIERRDLVTANDEAAQESRARGRILGRLRDQAGRGVRGRVELWRGSEESGAVTRKGKRIRRARSDETGKVVFDGLSDGQYQLIVEAGSLPEGYLPTWNQETLVFYGDSLPLGFYGRAVRIPSEGGEFQVEIRVFEAATVIGRVYYVDATDQPVVGAYVRLQNGGAGLQQLSADVQTDSNGQFEFTKVYPGRFRPQVIFAREHPLRSLGQPPQQDIEITAGSRISLDIKLGGGDATIEGIILDQDGAPFVGLDVLCYYHTDPRTLPPGARPTDWSDTAVAPTFTDADGRFRFSGLQRAVVALQAGSMESPVNGPGESILAAWPPVSIIDLNRGDAVDVRILAQRSRPFRVHGQIAKATLGEGKKTLRVEVVALDGSGKKDRVKVSRAGDFTWLCETPHEPVRLVAHFRDGPTLYEKVIVPEPNQSVFVTIP